MNDDLNWRIEMLRWIPHGKRPKHMNKLKLLVIPSYTESGPIIAQEAMSCGTPILATLAGHVLNMMEDGKTCFFMEDNTLECHSVKLVL